MSPTTPCWPCTWSSTSTTRCRCCATWPAGSGRTAASSSSSPTRSRCTASSPCAWACSRRSTRCLPATTWSAIGACYSLAGLRTDLAAAGLGVTAEFGYFLKTVPNGMMLDWPVELLEALNAISDDLPPHLLANIGVVARAV